MFFMMFQASNSLEFEHHRCWLNFPNKNCEVFKQLDSARELTTEDGDFIRTVHLCFDQPLEWFKHPPLRPAFGHRNPCFHLRLVGKNIRHVALDSYHLSLVLAKLLNFAQDVRSIFAGRTSIFTCLFSTLSDIYCSPTLDIWWFPKMGGPPKHPL